MTEAPLDLDTLAARLVALDDTADSAALDQSEAGVDEVAARFDQGVLVDQAAEDGASTDDLAEASGIPARTLRDRRQFATADLFADADGQPDRERLVTWARAASERAVEAGARLTYRYARREVFARPAEVDPAAIAAARVKRHLAAVRRQPCAVCGEDGAPRYARSLATDTPEADTVAVALSAVPLCADHLRVPAPSLWPALARTLAEIAEPGSGAVVAPRHTLTDYRHVPARLLDEPASFASWFGARFDAERPTWRPLDVAEAAGVGKDPVYRALELGRLEGVRLSDQTWVIPREAVRLWLLESHVLNAAA